MLAIIVTESFMRPAPMRALEYCAWLALTLLRSERCGVLSVGVGQIQLRHWRRLGLLESERFTRRNVARVRDPRLNYDACRRHLEELGVLWETDPTRLAGEYTGGSRRAYASLLLSAWPAVERGAPDRR